MLVPVVYAADGSDRLPITTPDQVQLYVDGFFDVYPTHGVEISVRDQPITFNQTLTSQGGNWNTLLTDIADLRQQDNAPNDTFYYGIFRPTANAGQFCGNGCVAGLGFVPGANDDYGRAAIGLGFAGGFSVGIAVHEVGHNAGRPHAPCGGVSGADPGFPHANGGIGVWGYSLGADTLIDPSVYADFMGYCNDNWISDYNYNLILDRLQAIAAQPRIIGEPTAWHRVMTSEGGTTQLAPIAMGNPGGVSQRIIATTESGAEMALDGHFLAYDHLEGGILFYPPTVQPLASVRFDRVGRTIVAPVAN